MLQLGGKIIHWITSQICVQQRGIHGTSRNQGAGLVKARSRADDLAAGLRKHHGNIHGNERLVLNDENAGLGRTSRRSPVLARGKRTSVLFYPMTFNLERQHNLARDPFRLEV